MNELVSDEVNSSRTDFTEQWQRDVMHGLPAHDVNTAHTVVATGDIFGVSSLNGQ